MAPPVNVQVHGLGRLIRHLNRIDTALAQGLYDAHERISQIVATAARTGAPVKSGALRGTIRGSRQKRRSVVRAGTARVPYTGPIHWGWPARHIAAQKFLLDAAKRTEPVWLPMYERELRRLVERVNQ